MFVFNTALSASLEHEQIVDCDGRYDMGRLENAILKFRKSTGTLGSAFFTIGSSARNANDHISWNKTTGDLCYDPDGNKAVGQVTSAIIGASRTISCADFIVV